MLDDPRCCGSGTCIIDDQGLCWCGQRWDGEKMVGQGTVCLPASVPTAETRAPAEGAAPSP